jgi:hypothetical protein
MARKQTEEEIEGEMNEIIAITLAKGADAARRYVNQLAIADAEAAAACAR